MPLQLASVRRAAAELPAVVEATRGVALVRDLVPELGGDLLDVLRAEAVGVVLEAAVSAPASAFNDLVGETFVAPYRHPRMIWGIGLNYVEHASDLTETVPEEPASFARNPRFLTRAKNFPGFFSFGPAIVPLDEVPALPGSLDEVEVATVLNGEVLRRNTVSRMRYDPAYLVSFHSKVMPLQPGDIISTGTPGAVQVRPGDVVECRIPGVGVLVNPVVGATRGRSR